MPQPFNQGVIAGLRMVSWLIGLAAMLLGVVVVAGWRFGDQALLAIRPGLPAMSPVTAVAVALAGTSLVLRKTGRTLAATATAWLLAALSAAVLAGYALAGRDVVNPLLGARLTTATAMLVGTTAPATASGLLLLALCLLCLGKTDGTGPRLLAVSSVVGMLVCGLALLCYAYGVEGLYAVAFYRTMAVQTAASLSLLFLACFVHDPERGWAATIASGQPSGTSTRVQLVFSTLVPFLIGLLVLRGLHVAPSLGIAIVVASTTVPLAARVLIDGRMLDTLETQRREAVSAQARLNEELEARVRERSASLASAEAKLRQSQKMEAIGQLTGGLAHDFNNMLTGISGSLDMMRMRLASGRVEDLDRYVALATASAQRAATLTHRLLSFSRRQLLDPHATDVNRLVAGMDELVRRTLGPNIVLEVVAAQGLWACLLDPPQLENALLNLCINARDAMPAGGRLTIETSNAQLDDEAAAELELPVGHYVCLSVSDTGVGMTQQVAERAFDPFFTTKPIGMGTGLGLSMVHGFVQQSGGQVRLRSQWGDGTAVCLYLPRHDGAAEPARDAAAAKPVPASERGGTVLVIDDEPAVRVLVTNLLEDLGYKAIEAADGFAGLRVLQSRIPIDLLISDVGLPGSMNGRQVADAARQLRPELKVLLITGFAESAILREEHLDPGMHVLSKPFAMNLLASRISELVEVG